MRPQAVIFGCGCWGQFFFDKIALDFDIAAFSDNNSALWGTAVRGKPVIAPEEIKKYGDAVVFICVDLWYLDVAKQLDAMGIPNIVYLDWFGMAQRYHNEVSYPASFRFRRPYKKEKDVFSVLYVQKGPCGRTDKISCVLKANGVMTQAAYTRCPSKMPEAYCAENAFYTYEELLEFVNESDFDIIHCSNEPDILANLLTHCNKPVIADTHDVMTVRDNNTSFERYYLEYAANKFADGNMYVNDYFRNLQIERYKICPDRTFALSNLIMENQIPQAGERKPKLSASDGELHLVYEGGITEIPTDNRFFEELWAPITAAHIHIHYYSQQSVPYCQALERTSPYLHYEGDLCGLELVTEMTQYDIGSILLNPVDKNAGMTYPHKLFEYLAAGLPVVSNLTTSLDFARSYAVGGGLDLQGDVQAQLRKIAAIRIPDRFLLDNKLTMETCAEGILDFYKKIIELGKARKG